MGDYEWWRAFDDVLVLASELCKVLAQACNKIEVAEWTYTFLCCSGSHVCVAVFRCDMVKGYVVQIEM